MTDQELIQALTEEFAPRIRELCADDKMDCEQLCAGNILTAKCIVFQAADRLTALQAEIVEKDGEIERLKNDVEGMRANWYKCSNNYQKKCRDIKVLESALSHIEAEAEAEAALGGGKG